MSSVSLKEEKKPNFKWLCISIVLVTLCCFLIGCSTSDNGVTLDSNPPQADISPTISRTDKQELPATEDNTSNAQPESTPAAPIPDGSTFSIHFIDVGQADSALVECDGHYMLIDGGNKADSDVVYSVLKKRAVPSLDLVVGTHSDEDHIGGLPGAFNYTTAAQTICPVTSYSSKAFSNFAKYAQTNGGDITVPHVGDHYELGSADVNILGVNCADGANNSSIVLKITYGETSFLFTGDAEREAEQVILDSGANLSSTVLKVGHHGSDSSTTYPFLREIMPQYAVISVGTGNSYGHPTENPLSRLRDAGVTVFRTDMQGDIYCTSDGKTVSFTTARNQDADTLSNPGASAASPQKPTTSPSPVTNTVPTEETTVQNPVETEYVLNNNTMKFHYPGCKSAATIKESNKGSFTGTRDELISKGFSPCGNCKP